MSSDLDDERKEAFLLALHSLKEEKEDTEAREEKLRTQQAEQLEARRREEANRAAAAGLAEQRRREETGRPRARDEQPRKPPPQPRETTKPHRAPVAKPPSSAPAPQGVYTRVTHLIAALQNSIINRARHVTTNPLAFLRTILFLLAFAFAFGKRDLRQRIMRLLRQAVDKVRGTVGMGVKVSYI